MCRLRTIVNLWCLLLGLFSTPTIAAHEAGWSNLEVIFGTDTIETRFVANNDDLAAAGRAGWTVDAAHAVELRAGGHFLAPRDTAEDAEDATSRRFVARFSRPENGPLAVRCALLDTMPAGHRQLLSVKDADGQLRASRLLKKESGWIDLRAALEKPAPDKPRSRRFTVGLARVGILFLAALGFCGLWGFWKRRKS